MSKIEKISNLLVTAGMVMAGGSMFIKSCFYTVDAGERAILFDKANGGIRDNIIGEGMHFYIPGLQKPIKYEIRLQAKTIASHTGTKDLQTVDITLRMLHRPIIEHLPSIYNNIGLNYDEKILPSIGNEVNLSNLGLKIYRCSI
jgi:prohibitin 1